MTGEGAAAPAPALAAQNTTSRQYANRLIVAKRHFLAGRKSENAPRFARQFRAIDPATRLRQITIDINMLPV
jgi:hypothetical protein